MDKNGARGRACSIVKDIINACIKVGMIDTALADLASTQELAMVKQEIQTIADEHTEQAKFHKAIEQGFKIDLSGVNPLGDKVCLLIGCEEEETKGQNSVLLYSLGYSIDFTMPTPEDARKLYEILLCVKEIEAD